ncbi:glutathione S-transferase family protein [Kibdelosporangium phytohabitans]|uniref:glutathione S-transferase family protein n=1 Tax=Kibdelosporangium phytohabitans TaxID=860235 RepID=UPI0009FAC6BD|nr:glutathione S-transferase C-terminal domain-containing protein [Kibdelosporangium phytohabitans]MBE1469605.1 putative glutathione S-transferase [Kibdelosporangium phytohabitans]
MSAFTVDGDVDWPVEPGRYRIVVSRACPWASRVLVVLRLMGLEDAVSVAYADPIQDEHGWGFPGGDPVLGIRYLSEAYLAARPGYDGGFSVPAVVDVPSGKLVTNDHEHITVDLATRWGAFARPDAPDLYPVELRSEIDAVNKRLAHDVNYGVYTCGFATSQAEYDEAYELLFAALDELSSRLAGQRYLVGSQITEADVRLFTVLVRFDVVYHGHFKCNRSKLSEMPVLRDYARDLFQTPGFGETVDFSEIKLHYHRVHTEINPSRIVPGGPDLSGWFGPHGRAAL